MTTSYEPGQHGPANRKAVMVIYGHDHEANSALFSWLRAIGLQPREWSQLIQLSGSASPFIGHVLQQASQHVQAVVALFTPDERVRGRTSLPAASHEWRLQARPNVLIEAGMALVIHPDRTVLITLGPQELPSDLAGRHYIRLNRTSAPLYEIASRLHDAGCDTDLTGTDWLDPTRFPDRDKIPASPPQAPPGVVPATVGAAAIDQPEASGDAEAHGTLDQPRDGGTVDAHPEISGQVTGVPPAHHLWIVVRRVHGGVFWPKWPEVGPDHAGKFRLSINEGGTPGLLVISLLMVPTARSLEFDRWLQLGTATGNYPLRPEDADIELAGVTVTYNPASPSGH